MRVHLRKSFHHQRATILPPCPRITRAVIGYRLKKVYGDLTTYFIGTVKDKNKYIGVEKRDFGIKTGTGHKLDRNWEAKSDQRIL